jgi:hypothetical protein
MDESLFQLHNKDNDIKARKKKKKVINLGKRDFWRCRGSNPVPLACKASALPFELHPRLTLCRTCLVLNAFSHLAFLPVNLL